MAAILRYNNSMPYAQNVLGWAAAYATGVVPVDLPPIVGPPPPLGSAHDEHPEGLGPSLPMNINGLPDLRHGTVGAADRPEPADARQYPADVPVDAAPNPAGPGAGGENARLHADLHRGVDRPRRPPVGPPLQPGHLGPPALQRCRQRPLRPV